MLDKKNRIMKRQKKYFLVTSILILFCASCGCPVMEVDLAQLQEKIYEPSAVRHKALNQSTVLYLDNSTCVIDARQHSPVFRSLLGQLGVYTDTLCLIRGAEFEITPNTDKSPTSTTVYNIINNINIDIPFADIGQAVSNICNRSSQAILISDCEYFDRNRNNQDGFPYMSGAFKNWLQRGYVIYIVTEPYQERSRGRTYDKKRFYLIFTDDRLAAPISHNMLNELNPFINNRISVFKLTNSDLQVQRDGDMVEKDLTFTYEGKNGFDYIEIDNDWDDIREYVMKLDKYGEPLPEEKPLPIIKNLTFNDGKNYIITNVEIVAANITAQYSALSDSASIDDIVESPEAVNMSDGFLIDKEALQSHKLNVMLTDKIFDYLECGGNLIRLDFVITQVGLQPYDAGVFTWQSLYSADMATCVSRSIDNALRDIEVVPTYKDRKVIHTVFLKTQSYN
jgi:hypothetical protein